MRLRIRDLREDNDLKQREIADYLMCDQSLYSKYERGERLLPLDLAYKLADYYKTAPLPESRQEFEDRATLLHILRCLKTFLLEKREFVQGLTAGEKARYWTAE